MKLLQIIFFIFLSGICTAQQEKLLWSDEFEGKGLPDSVFWSYDLGKSGFGNNEVQNYRALESNVRQENGVLIIEAIKSGNEWTSARIKTQNKFDFTYGRIEFKAKLPAGSGTWPALWLLGSNIDEVGWPSSGEVDVMEHVGKNPGVIHTTIHTPSSCGNSINTKTIAVDKFDTEFHLYEANWSSESIEFKIDGKLHYTYNPKEKNSATWPFNKAFFIIMNIAMGGNFGSDPKFETPGLKNGIDPKLSIVRMEVDYVRVYQNFESEIKK